MTGALATLFVAGVAEAKTKATISGPVQVTEAKAGGSAAALLTDDVAKAAVETKLAWAEACGEVPAGQTQTYQATLEVDGNGAVTAVTRGEFSVSAEIASCLDGLLREVKTAALPTPEAAVKIVVQLSLAGDAVAPAAPAAAPAAAAALEADIKAGQEKVAEHKDAAKEEAKTEAKAEEKKPEAPTKPWRVNAMLNFSVGNGSFIKDQTVNAGYAGYDFRFGGSYDLSEMFRAGVTFQMAQELSSSSVSGGTVSGGTIPREFMFGETLLSLSTRKLFVEEKYTGIKLNANVGIVLPTAKAALAAERIMGLNIGGKVDKVFENVGPGSLSLNWTLGYRENLGPRTQSYSENKNQSAYLLCRDKLTCTGPVNTARTLSNMFNVSYSFFDKWSATLTLGWINNFKWDVVGDSSAPVVVAATGSAVTPRTSNNATARSGQTDLVVGNLDLSYQITDMFSVSTGLATAGDPFIYDNGKYSLRFPFWDAATPALNLSTIYLNFGFVY